LMAPIEGMPFASIRAHSLWLDGPH
jgi:hypothetical protein